MLMAHQPLIYPPGFGWVLHFKLSLRLSKLHSLHCERLLKFNIKYIYTDH